MWAFGDGTATPASPFHNAPSKHALQDDEAKAEYWKMHCDPATIKERNGGAHFLYLEEFLKRNGGGQGWVVGTEMSIAGQCWVLVQQSGRPDEGRSQHLGCT